MKLNSPLISVVMSVYNGEKYLAEAIESILNQTYKNFEFIIVNDGSSDKSIDIIKEYMTKDNRVVLIDRENKGLPYSLNEGISKAKGEYIARMDADDISLPDRFEKQMDYMQKNEIDICGCSIQLFNDAKKFDIWHYPIKDSEIRFLLLVNSAFAHPSIMFKKSIFETYQYDIKFKSAQDYKLWTQIALSNLKMGNIDEVLVLYRIHDTQVSSKNTQQAQNAINISKEYIKDFFHMTNYEIRQIIENIFKYKETNNTPSILFLLVLKELYRLHESRTISSYFQYLKYATKIKFSLKNELKFLVRFFYEDIQKFKRF